MITRLPRIVSIEWLASRLDDDSVVIVDARPPEQYHSGHIPGTRNLDIYQYHILDSDPEVVGAWVGEMQDAFRALGVRSGDHVVFYEDISGTSAARGVWLMEALSIGNGSLLDGGLAAWQAAGHSLSAEPVSVAPSDVTLTLDRVHFTFAADLIHDLANGNETRIIDTRNRLEWIQGTIPTATHLEWTAHLDTDGKLKSLDELRVLYQELGIAPTDAVVTFCASGYRAAHTWLVLSELGYDSVSNYAPSWGEWGRRADVPVEIPD